MAQGLVHICLMGVCFLLFRGYPFWLDLKGDSSSGGMGFQSIRVLVMRDLGGTLLGYQAWGLSDFGPGSK